MRLQIAPVSRSGVLIGKALACFFSVMLVISFMVGLGLLLGMRPGSYPMLALAALCVASCFVGIMMVMSNLGKNGAVGQRRGLGHQHGDGHVRGSDDPCDVHAPVYEKPKPFQPRQMGNPGNGRSHLA